MAPPAATTSTAVQQTADSSARPTQAPARPATPALRRNATDDEILGLNYRGRKGTGSAEQAGSDTKGQESGGDGNAVSRELASQVQDSGQGETEPENFRDVFDANPELRSAWEDAQAYRKVFATPQEAQAATAMLADLDRMDALFFSRRPEDHRQLAHAIAELDPTAFASLARAINAHLANGAARGRARNESSNARPADDSFSARNESSVERSQRTEENPARAEVSGLTERQAEFFQAANASAVEGVVEAIEGQVERLLPEGVNKSARTRVVAEIYRELDASLRSNRQLAQQLREAFRSGSLDEEHQRAVVSLITGRARQALPGVAKRVLHEWTSTLVAANQERRARQRSAERRVDIAGSGGSGNDGRRAIGPRDIDYARMSDADILNL
jgi:hypothetical protein